MTQTAEQTLASIVTGHHQTVPVLEKYNLDFCCKGKRTLSQACTEKGLSVQKIMEELNIATLINKGSSMPFAEMTAEQLIGYIIIHHHFYLKQSMPTIAEHLTKVATKHAQRFPYMSKVLDLFLHLKNEMMLHMHKEETILFPRIKEVESFYHFKQQKNLGINYIDGPVVMMENEHDEAGAILYKIRQLTNNYIPPEEACTTFKVSLAELKEFEEDLHRHVHLENNILFPLAQKMLAAVSAYL